MELGRTVAFLRSPQSAYLTGVAVPIHGGEGASTL
jgi:NAD(P)-dependent dehydrogenase (short-subunit alcohol dehydrogenase family)